MTNRQIIDFNEIDFEENIYDFFKNMMYKGKPFTGILREEGSTTEYKNGNANGFAYSYFSDGKIGSETQYRNGELVQSKDWYPNGKLMSKYDKEGWFMYAKDGTLAYESKSGVAVWYYKQGKIKQSENKDSSQTICYSPSGKIAIKIERTKGIFIAEYFDNILLSDFKEIVTNFYPELNSLSSSSGGHDHFPEHCFQLWVLKLLVEKPNIGKVILKELKDFADDKIKNMAKTIEMHIVDFNLLEVTNGDWGYCGYKIKNYL